MQDAHQKFRPQVLCLLAALALGLSAILSHSVQDDRIPMACEAASCLFVGDVMGDGGQDGELPVRLRFRSSAPNPADAVTSVHSFSGLAHSASFPVLPQAPPLA